MTHKLPSSMSMQIITHVITLHLHIITKLIKTRRTNHVTFAIDLPRNRSVLRTHFIVAGSTRGRSRVVVHIRAILTFPIHDHAANHIGVKVGFVIDNREHLSLYAHGRCYLLFRKIHECLHGQVAEQTIVEGSLILIHRVTCSGCRMWPMHLVRFPHLHSHAMLPRIRRCEFGTRRIVVMTSESIPHGFLVPRSSSKTTEAIGPVGSHDIAMRTIAIFVVFAHRIMLRPEVPMHVHRTHGLLEVRSGDGDDGAHVDLAHVAPRDVRSGLGLNFEVGAEGVIEGDFGSGACVVVDIVEEGGGGLALQVSIGGYSSGWIGGGAATTIIATAASDGKCDAGAEKAEGGKAE
mmetsp:Transcript_18570/g.29142  ORF Transcript_18570/g.29142 Transcript_18570/m.29142 type:complete len:348 (-) Transcript_18570:259-1302(-)